MGFLTSMPMLPTFKGYLMFSFQTKKKYKKYYHQVPCLFRSMPAAKDRFLRHTELEGL